MANNNTGSRSFPRVFLILLLALANTNADPLCTEKGKIFHTHSVHEEVTSVANEYFPGDSAAKCEKRVIKTNYDGSLFGSDEDTIRVCRGQRSCERKPSCWVTIDGSNGIMEILQQLVGGTISVYVVSTPNLSQSGSVNVLKPWLDEMENMLIDFEDMFYNVCYDGGSFSATDIGHVSFHGHSKGGAVAILLAYKLTSYTLAKVGGYPASQTEIVTTGAVRPFYLSDDEDIRRFQAVSMYQAVDITSDLVVYDAIYSFPQNAQHFPRDMVCDEEVTRKHLVRYEKGNGSKEYILTLDARQSSVIPSLNDKSVVSFTDMNQLSLFNIVHNSYEEWTELAATDDSVTTARSCEEDEPCYSPGTIVGRADRFKCCDSANCPVWTLGLACTCE